jgi:plastocyanin
MGQKSLRRLVGGSAVALLAALSFTASAGAADHRRVVMMDDCEPVSFNAAVPSAPGDPPTCVGEGETTFPDFIQQLIDEGAAKDWEFSRDHFNIDSGGRISVVNEGGEFHSFTQVKAFGGGCVPALNGVLGLTPVPECDEMINGVPKIVATGAVPGGKLDVAVSGAGTQMYQCLIHPWMRSVVDVRDKD